MSSFKLFGAALILSTAFATPVFAQSAGPGLPELPGDYAFFNWAADADLRLGSAFAPAPTVQPPPVLVAQAVRPVRPHRAHHISGAP